MTTEILYDTGNKDIILTVGLPIYKGEKIVWLALESLKNQENINFQWELIIWEENGLSKELIKTYTFPNCARILYRKLDKKILLIDKWIGMSKESSKTSKVFVFQDADDYSPKRRLYIHNEHFKNINCKYSTQIMGIFYNLKDKKKIFYLGSKKESRGSRFFTQNHLNKAIRTEDMRKVRHKNIVRYIDSYIRIEVEHMNRINFKTKKYVYTDFDIDKENWKTGFFTDGANIISLERKLNYQMPKGVFLPYQIKNTFNYQDMNKYIPQYILQKL